MNTRISSMAAALAAFFALTGCVQSSPRFDAGFGSSVRATLVAQVADPAAAANSNPVTGIDGRAAAGGQQRYESSFARPAEHQSAVSGSAK
jgi:type IV pilus biogenesis protein CpaD/CtpE